MLFKNSLFGSIFFVFCSGLLMAQTSNISGFVHSEDGEAVADAHIYISENKWAVSDEQGFFEIKNLSSGTYSIRVSRVGYETLNLPLSVPLEVDEPLAIVLTKTMYYGKNIVVTATRTTQELENVPTSIDVISSKEIKNSGATTLKDILLEQTGISLAPDEENAIQIQGFESDYTLIMIDGQPVIGRTRGALDLSRINVANIEQVEVIKGPSSALWGSDALAGVINIITKKSNRPFQLNAHSQYGMRNTYDVGANASFLRNNLSGSLGITGNGSGGFDLSDSTFGNNQNPFDAITLNSNIDYNLSDQTEISVKSRYFRNQFEGPTIASVQGEVIEIKETGWQDDFSLHGSFKTSPLSGLTSAFYGYITRYEDFSTTLFEDPNEPDIDLNNKQGLDKVELQNDYSWSANNITTFGGGASWEFIEAVRFNGQHKQSGNFAFLQHQFMWNDALYVIAGGRLDNHSSYSSYVSPKLAVRYSITEKINLRASVGQGFKAPDFRTLYLDFDNSGSGYSVFGTMNILNQIETLRSQNLIRTELVDITRLSTLDPEYSTAYNAGISYGANDKPYSFTINFFRNDAENLIDAQEVVELTNGNSIFGYLNINRARTQGIEFENSFSPVSGFNISVGYQYLEAVELASQPKTVIENGQVVTKNVEVEIPLPKRPKHSGNLKVFYREPVSNIEFSLRGILRGEYLQNDRAINGIGVIEKGVDDYVPAHSIWNLTLGKQLNESFRIQLGANNLLNHIDEEYLPAQPGRTIFTRITFQY